LDLGESLPDTAVRETLEETGVRAEVTGLVGIYTDPRHVILYTSNGEARQEFSVVFTAGRSPESRRRAPSRARSGGWNPARSASW
jgi:8-oxo-dGTP pyrophosphatase MutT (NUDIX family)